MLHVEPLFRNLDGISSRKYNKSPPPFEFLSNLYGVQNPFNLKWGEENESSFSLVSEINNMSILVSMMKDNAPNLFLIELIFKWPTIIQFSMLSRESDWFYYSRTLTNKINRIHKRVLRIVYSDYNSSFNGFLDKDGLVAAAQKLA